MLRCNEKPTKLKRWLCLLAILAVKPAGAGVSIFPEYYEFHIPWDDDNPTIFDVSGEILDAPAGKHGEIYARGDKLVFKDEYPVKFWGLAVTVSKDFPPIDKKEAKTVVRKLSKYGINLVRLNGLDFVRIGLYKNWINNNTLDKKVMDRLDFFISLLRNAGIYYSLSINNASLKGRYGGKITPNGHPVKHKKYKYVQLYDERIIERVVKWCRDFYAHKNTYTNLTYAQDPANIYVTAVGEDSMFNGYFRKNAQYLGDEQRLRLQEGFDEYLAQKNGAVKDTEINGWRREETGKIRKQADLVKPDDLAEAGQKRSRDLVRFLYQLDKDYAVRMHKALMDAGYKGLFTVTNDWYGYASLLLNAEAGDFIDMHGYFDPLLRVKAKGGGRPTEMVRNVSYLASPYYAKNGDVKALEANFYRFFAGAVENKPLLISEWNHSAWSQYAYEGPIMLTAYSALQGWSGMVIHTYLSNDLGFKSSYSSNSLAVSGNPVLMSLSPTLALASTKGYIKESESLVPVTIATNKEELWDAVLRDKLDPLRRKNGVSYNSGFIHKIRVRLLGVEEDVDRKREETAGSVWRSDTGEITWYHSKPEEALLTVDTPKFQAALGRLDNVEARLSNIEISLKEHGAVTAIALDDQPLSESTSILLTAVSSFKNSNAVKESVRKFRRWRNLTHIIRPGEAPTLMKRVVGSVVFKSRNKNMPQVYGVAVDGGLQPVQLVKSGDGQNDNGSVKFGLGTVDTPWYWISYSD